MKIKRVFLIVIVGLSAFMMCFHIYGLQNFIDMNPYMDYVSVSFYVSVMSYVSNIALYLRAICLLAVVDFLFCVGQQRYSKSMLGISVAAFALAIIMHFMKIVGTSFFYKIIMLDSPTVMAYCYLWTALSTLPFVGLTVSYIAVKAKYLKSQSKNNEMIVETN